MPVSLTEWRVRIGRFIQNPPDINKHEMIQRFLERWRAKKEMSKTAESQQQSTCLSSTKTTCQQGTPSSTPETNPVPTCQPSSQISCQQGTPRSTPETNPVPTCQPSSQTSCQQGTPSCTPETDPVPTCQPSSQTSCQQETSSCTSDTNPVPHSTSRRPAVWCISQVLFTFLMLMKTCFPGLRKLCISMILDQFDGQSQTSLPSETKMFSSTSYFGRGLYFCIHLTSCIGFCVYYLSVILLMRSGNVETNPGPESTISDMEFIKLAKAIPISSYAEIGVALEIPYTQTQAILAQHLNNYTNALLDIFMKWNIKQLPDTNKREVLADELLEIDLGDLSNRLRNGSLIPNRTAKPLVQPTSPPSPPRQPPSPPHQPPSPPHQPLSPELIQKCAEDFKFEYSDTLCKIRADPLNPDSLVPFEDMYTNLVLEEEDGRYKQVLEYSDLVNLKGKTKFSKRLLVQGEAGAGKTTLCSKIAWDWINGIHFQQFVWVIIVPLREAKKYSIGEIAKSYLTSNNPTTASQLTEYMHLNTDKVFIVFDGLDEFEEDDAQPEEGGSQTSGLQSSQIQDQSSNQSGSTQYQTELQSASGEKKASSAEMEIRLEEILRSEKLETAPVLVTTRPWKAVKIRRNDRLRKKYTFLYVEGFGKQNIASYIEKYFVRDKAKAESLIQFAEENDIISENMAPYPIYISMLCLMWREFDDEKQKKMKALQTFSQIFEEIFVFLKEHYALKMANPSCSLDESLNKCLKDVNKLLEPTGELALNGLLRNNLVFSEGEFEHCQDSMKTACRVGVLSEESRIILGKGRRDASNPRLQPTVFFPHKLFQEFMAGIHLASLYETDNREYNRLMETVTGHRKVEFRYLLYFTASRNQTVGIDVLTHIGRSIQRKDKHFLVDVAFECHDTHAAAVTKDKVLHWDGKLVLDDIMTAHTVAGYAFIKPDIVR